jgi:hypothetical protein
MSELALKLIKEAKEKRIWTRLQGDFRLSSERGSRAFQKRCVLFIASHNAHGQLCRFFTSSWAARAKQEDPPQYKSVFEAFLCKRIELILRETISKLYKQFTLVGDE